MICHRIRWTVGSKEWQEKFNFLQIIAAMLLYAGSWSPLRIWNPQFVGSIMDPVGWAHML